jgi:NitT/TauT family transport system substrate-binding protein
MKLIKMFTLAAITAGALAWGAVEARAQESLKLAIGQRGNWENAMPELGQNAGIFKKHGLNLELLYTQGGGETQQAVISGSVDIGIGAGTGGAMGAFVKGAPIRAFANSMTGVAEFWYVPSNSPIKTMKDAAGKSIAFSTRGSSTNTMVLAFIKHFGVDAKPVATGNPASTFTQTMTNQVDIGWSSPPFGLEALEQGRIRIVARGSEVPAFRDQTVRVQIVNANALQQKKDAIARFVQAWRETLDWMYSDPAAIKAYAEWVNVPEALAQRVRDEFYPKDKLNPDRISGLDEAMADAVESKFIPAPLNKEQIDQFFQLQTVKK